jgi:hypothetical protein
LFELEPGLDDEDEDDGLPESFAGEVFEDEDDEDEDDEDDDDSEDEDEDDEDDGPLAEADEEDRESVMYQPLPLNTMPTGWMTLRKAPPHCSQVVSGGSEKLCRFSTTSLQAVHV